MINFLWFRTKDIKNEIHNMWKRGQNELIDKNFSICFQFLEYKDGQNYNGKQ